MVRKIVSNQKSFKHPKPSHWKCRLSLHVRWYTYCIWYFPRRTQLWKGTSNVYTMHAAKCLDACRTFQAFQWIWPISEQSLSQQRGSFSAFSSGCPEQARWPMLVWRISMFWTDLWILTDMASAWNWKFIYWQPLGHSLRIAAVEMGCAYHHALRWKSAGCHDRKVAVEIWRELHYGHPINMILQFD